VAARRRVNPAAGRAAIAAWRADPDGAARDVLATAVLYGLEELATRYPGGATEVRVPPFGVVQCIPGPRHTRGTPSNVVEVDAAGWLALITGDLTWDDALASGRLRASGERSDLSLLLPLF
jgi:hypothetical protein